MDRRHMQPAFSIGEGAPNECSQWSKILERAAGALQAFPEMLCCLKQAHAYYSGEASIMKIRHHIANLSHVITET